MAAPVSMIVNYNPSIYNESGLTKRFQHSAPGQGVGPFVELIPSGTLDPPPVHLMPQPPAVEAPPKAFIFHGPLVEWGPAPRLPQADPLGETVLQLLPV